MKMTKIEKSFWPKRTHQVKTYFLYNFLPWKHFDSRRTQNNF